MKEIKTERVLLRGFRTEDFEDLVIMMSDPDVMRLTAFRTPQSREKVKECLDKWINKNAKPLFELETA